MKLLEKVKRIADHRAGHPVKVIASDKLKECGSVNVPLVYEKSDTLITTDIKNEINTLVIGCPGNSKPFLKYE